MPGIGGAGYAAQQAKRQDDANQQWKKVQAANAGGHTGTDGYTTDFEAAAGLQNLRDMVMHADPDAIHKVSAQWTTIGGTLDETAHDLTTHVNNLLQHWSGASADAFRENAGNLHTSLSNGAQYAHTTSGAMSDAAIALTEAQRDMPDMPGFWDKASRAVTSETGDVQFKNDAAAHGLSYAVQHDGSQLSAVEEAHQKAVLVMETVGTKYNAAAAKMTAPPPHNTNGGVWPPPQQGPSTPVSKPGPVTGGPGHSPVTGGPGSDPVTPVPPIHGPTPVPLPPGHNPGPVPPIQGQGPVGTPTPPPPPPGTTLDGGTGGPTTGTGTGTGGPGTGGVSGVGGIGKGAGGGVGGAGGGAAFGGGGLGGASAGLATGAGGGGFGAGGRLGGGSGLAGEEAGMQSGSALGEGEAGLAAGEKGAAGAGAAEGRSGMGMGGMGGAGRGAGNKKKRKGRAAYLLEDEETWSQDDAPNPPVIG